MRCGQTSSSGCPERVARLRAQAAQNGSPVVLAVRGCGKTSTSRLVGFPKRVASCPRAAAVHGVAMLTARPSRTPSHPATPRSPAVPSREQRAQGGRHGRTLSPVLGDDVRQHGARVLLHQLALPQRAGCTGPGQLQERKEKSEISRSTFQNEERLLLQVLRARLNGSASPTAKLPILLAFLCDQNLIEQQAQALCNLRQGHGLIAPERTAHPDGALLHHGIANGHPAAGSVPLERPRDCPP